MSEVWLPRRRSPRRKVTLLALTALASAGGVVSTTGDGQVSGFYCENLVTTMRTSEPSYAHGQTVIIRVTLRNKGPACSIASPSPCGPPPAGASAYNSAGQVVWESGAGGGHITCPPELVTSVSYPAGYSDTEDLDWSQDKCAFQPRRPVPILVCPRTHVPAGTYRIVASDGTSGRATATITLTGQTPLQRARHRSSDKARPAGGSG